MLSGRFWYWGRRREFGPLARLLAHRVNACANLALGTIEEAVDIALAAVGHAQALDPAHTALLLDATGYTVPVHLAGRRRARALDALPSGSGCGRKQLGAIAVGLALTRRGRFADTVGAHAGVPVATIGLTCQVA